MIQSKAKQSRKTEPHFRISMKMLRYEQQSKAYDIVKRRRTLSKDEEQMMSFLFKRIAIIWYAAV